jgi:hypothetical protein
MSRAPPTALVARLPSGSHVIDLRHAPRASVVELDVFAAVAGQLEASGPARGLRVWVLGDATVDWLADPAQCWAAIFNLLEASRPGPDDSDLTLIAVLAGAARKEAAFPSLLRAAGLQVFAARPAGGLPLQEVMIGGQSSTSPIGPPMPGEAPDPPVLLRMAEAIWSLPAEGDSARYDAVAIDWIAGRLGRELA